MEPDREQPPTEVERLRAEIEKIEAEALWRVWRHAARHRVHRNAP